jgi:hypothetical protein
MAEIRVEQKRRSLAWLWVVLAVAAAALAYWYFNNDGVNQVDVQTGLVPTVRGLVVAMTAPLGPSGAEGALRALVA